MWTCPKCKRQFSKANQPHTCKKVALKEHFKNKELAKELFETLVDQISIKIGKGKIISIPCCVHLFGKYDFLAALPKKDRLEIRFLLDSKISNKRFKAKVPISKKSFKYVLDIYSKKEIDKELLKWLRSSYLMRE